MMVNVTRQKLGTRYETLLHSTQLATVWGSTQLSAAGPGLNATRVGRRCFCEWGDADLCWLNRAACANHTWYFELKFKNKKVSSGEIDIICYVRYNTSSEEVHNLKVHQLQGPFFFWKISSACLSLFRAVIHSTHRSFTRPSDSPPLLEMACCWDTWCFALISLPLLPPGSWVDGMLHSIG